MHHYCRASYTHQEEFVLGCFGEKKSSRQCLDLPVSTVLLMLVSLRCLDLKQRDEEVCYHLCLSGMDRVQCVAGVVDTSAIHCRLDLCQKES